MNRKIMIKLMIVLVLTLSTGILTSTGIQSKSQAIAIVPASIIIDGNVDFEAKSISNGWSGDGTKNNPYIVENYIFSMTGIGTPGVNISNTDRYFILRNVTVTGSTNSGVGGIHFNNVSNALLENNNVTGNSYGIFLSGSSNYNTLIQNKANSNGINGIYLSSSFKNILFQNTAKSNDQFGIFLSSSNKNSLTQNTANLNSRNGIYLYYSSSSNTIINNTVNNNNQNGIILDSSSSYNSLTNNSANSNGMSGIFLTGSSSYNTLTQNAVKSNNQTGIYLSSSNKNILSQNTANLNNIIGIYLSSSNKNSLIKNSVNSNSKDGIYLDPSSSYNTLTNNSANSNGIDGIYLSSSSNYNFLTNNSANNNNDSGIYLSGSSNYNTLTNNSANNNNDSGIYLSGSSNYKSSNNTLTNNSANNNGKDGISLDYSYNNTLNDNSANNNTLNGIYLESYSDYNMLVNNSANNNRNSGIYLYYSSYNTLTNNSANNNTLSGIVLTFKTVEATLISGVKFLYTLRSEFNTLTLNTANSNGINGFRIDSESDNTTLIQNTANNNKGAGFVLRGENTTLIQNTANSNSYYGFLLTAPNNTLTNNSANSNNYTGFYLKQSRNNTLTNNSANNNSINGIDLQNSMFNIVINNTANGNGMSGIYLDSSPNNILLSNSLINGGIQLNCVFIAGCSQTQMDGNTVNGLDILFLQDTTNQIISDRFGQIILVNSSYLTVKDQIMTNVSSAIQLYFSSNNVLTNNSVINNSQYGFKLMFSSNNTIINNTANSNAKYGFNLLRPSYNNILTQRTVNSNDYSGIYLVSSPNNILLSNSLINGGIQLNCIGIAGCSQTQVDRNTVNGLDILFLQDTTNQIISDRFGQIILVNSTYLTVKDQIMTNVSSAIQLYFSSNNVLTNNSIINNSQYGFKLVYSSNNTILRNFIFNNRGYSITIVGNSKNNTISGNRIEKDNLGGSQSQALDNGIDNIFYFNFWNDWTDPDNNGDYIVDTPYSIDGIVNNQDLLPLLLSSALAPIITLYNQLNEYIYQSGSIIDLNVIGSNGVYIYNWDNTANTTVSYTYDPIIPTEEGVHVLYIYAQDELGFRNSAIFSVITDDTPPTMNLNNQLNSGFHQSGAIVDLNIVGSNGTLIYNWDNTGNNTVSDTYDPTLPTGEGVHLLNLYTRDVAGNWVYKQFTFITDDTPPTITFISLMFGTTEKISAEITLSFGNSSDDPLVKITEYSYNWDGTVNLTVPVSTKPVTPTSPGIHKLFIYVTDEAGNIGYAYYEFIVQETSQTISTTLPQSSIPSKSSLEDTSSNPSSTPGFELVVLIGSFIALNLITLYKRRKRF